MFSMRRCNSEIVYNVGCKQAYMVLKIYLLQANNRNHFTKFASCVPRKTFTIRKYINMSKLKFTKHHHLKYFSFLEHFNYQEFYCKRLHHLNFMIIFTSGLLMKYNNRTREYKGLREGRINLYLYTKAKMIR